jgi:hypothetical protein
MLDFSRLRLTRHPNRVPTPRRGPIPREPSMAPCGGGRERVTGPTDESRRTARVPPANPTPDQSPDLVLHIGSGKTGTSSIQRLMRRNRGLLLEHGVLFPSSPGPRRHVRFGLYFKTDDELVETRPYRSQGHPSPQAFRETFRTELFAEIEEARPGTVLISDEALYGSDNASLSRLRAFTDAHAGRLRLVCYLRRQDDHLVSRYQQVVKTGETRTLAERTAELDHTKTYDYAARLDTWARLLEPDAFVVRRFEKGAFVHDSLYADFLDAAGLDVPPDALREVASQNESLDAESVEFLRLLNLHLVRAEGAQVGMVNHRPLVARLAAGSAGPTLTLPDPELDAFMACWRDSNRDVARRYLGDDDLLFRVPRKTHGTTTVQRLDPDRLAHFLELTELAEDLHAPLRRLAEDVAVGR